MAPQALRSQTHEDLDALEAHYVEQYHCARCFDWKTVVIGGTVQPCARCQYDRWKSWILAESPGLLVVIAAIDQLCVVALPSDFGIPGQSPVQPCYGPRCDEACVLVQTEDRQTAPWWVPVSDVEIWAKGADVSSSEEGEKAS